MTKLTKTELLAAYRLEMQKAERIKMEALGYFRMNDKWARKIK